ncbi:MAG: cbb3-type cytochrome c oxidase subunit I [Opitutales bacterium]|nr:cbb3-type cytochrome c oxidase subunit I [Opitutales bacterium]NRA26639.1 cbb3-type cytochrome c oxidase subunit I [Opitutales bacterium]
MSTLAPAPSPSEPITSPSSEERVTLSAIDDSVRGPAILFVSSSIVWLMIGTVFALMAAFKAHTPEFMGNIEWSTFGRARSAHLNAMAYGWGFNVAAAVALWLMARLSKVKLMHGGILYISGAFWNLGVIIGVFGILKGDMTSVEWLEMPPYAAPLLAVAYLGIGFWGVQCFLNRKQEFVYVSQWYVLAALFWLPWLYIIAQVMINFVPARGVVQSITNWWFAHNVLGLWFTPIGLAAVYYFIPKVLGRPIHSYYLSVLGFWSLALFYNWAGVHHLVGGPIPVWLITAGIVGSVMMVIPVIVTAINHHLSVVGHHREVWASPTLRFTVFGAMNYTLASLIGSLMAIREVNLVTHFTHFTVGHAHHGLYAFFTMVMFGAIYFIMPRLLKREWPSAILIKVHFWTTAVGITAMVIALSVGGWIQGSEMNNPEIEFLDIVKNTVPYLYARSVSGILLTVGHIAFAVNFFWLLIGGRWARYKQGPTLIGEEAEA